MAQTLTTTTFLQCITSATIFLLILASNSSSVSAASRVEQIRDGHPTDFLVSSLPGAAQEEKPAVSRAEEQKEVESMTHQLMERLAAKGADPNRPSVRYILELFEQMEKGANIQEARGEQTGREDVLSGADVIRGLAPANVAPPTKRRHKADVALNFPLSGLTGSEQMELAELRIRPLEQHPVDRRPSGARVPVVRPARRSGLQRVRVSILDKEGDRQLERIYRVRWRLDQKDDFDVLDVTRILQDMVASGARDFQNGSLEISLRKTRRVRGGGSAHRNRRSVHASGELTENDAMMVVYSKSIQEPETDSESDKTPVPAHPERTLVGRGGLPSGSDVSENILRRSRRAVGGGRKHKKQNKNRCQAKEMYIDFETLGWADDIIFPIRYNAMTCSGKCPSPVDHSLHPTNHAILKSMMRMYNKKTPRPCCVPTSLKPLMMLYKLADGNIEIRHHPDMVVDQCGCR